MATTQKAPFTYPLSLAKRFVHLFERTKPPVNEQQALLAAAYYTLSVDESASHSQSNIHINSAIALLKKIPRPLRKNNWNSQIAHAYFKRAELLEDKAAFGSAIYDYQQVMVAFEANRQDYLNDKDKLILAQSAISIADLLVTDHTKENTSVSHPLFYINKGLEYLANVTETDQETWATHAYAHRIAGVILSVGNFAEAKEAFRVALLMAFKSDNSRVCPLLADLYSLLGLLYEQNYEACPIQKDAVSFLDHARIYFELSLLFTPSQEEEDDNETDYVLGVESLFELIYRVLDPSLSELTYQPVSDLIDALIYAFICVIDKVLPNKNLEQQLDHPDVLDTYAQHVHWLLIEAYRRKHIDEYFIQIMDFKPVKFEVDAEQVFFLMQNQGVRENVYYLPTFC